MALNINIKDNSFTLDFLDFSGGLNTRDLDTVIKDTDFAKIKADLMVVEADIIKL